MTCPIDWHLTVQFFGLLVLIPSCVFTVFIALSHMAKYKDHQAPFMEAFLAASYSFILYIGLALTLIGFGIWK